MWLLLIVNAAAAAAAAAAATTDADAVVAAAITKIFLLWFPDYWHFVVCTQVKRLVVQLLKGVEHMHAHWYLHRDLKTSNLLYSKGKLCICDFGLARKYGRYFAAAVY